MFDRLFDILNSRSPHARGSKAPLSAENWASTLRQLDETESYIRGIRLKDGTPVLQSAR